MMFTRITCFSNIVCIVAIMLFFSGNALCNEHDPPLVLIKPLTFQGYIEKDQEILINKIYTIYSAHGEHYRSIEQQNLKELISKRKSIKRLVECGIDLSCLKFRTKRTPITHVLYGTVIQAEDQIILSLTLADIHEEKVIASAASTHKNIESMVADAAMEKLVKKVCHAEFVTDEAASEESVTVKEEKPSIAEATKEAEETDKTSEKKSMNQGDEEISGENRQNKIIRVDESYNTADILPGKRIGKTANQEGGVEEPEIGIPVLDLCALPSSTSSNKFVKSGIVLFRPAGTDLIEKGEIEVNKDGVIIGHRNILRKIKARRHVEKVFLSAFPLKRFNTVIAPTSATPDIMQSNVLGIKQLGNIVKSKTSLPAGVFSAYSLWCASYIAMPEVTGYSAKWERKVREVKVKGRKIKRKIWDLEFSIDFRMHIFKRYGNEYRRHATVAAKGGGLFDFAAELGASVMKSVPTGDLLAGGGNALANVLNNHIGHVSPSPNRSCKIPHKGIAGKPQLDKCTGTVKSLPTPSGLVGISEANGKYCTNVDYEHDMDGVARCEVRKKTDNTAKLLQKEARGVEGWKLYAPLQLAGEDNDDPAISLGDDEGVTKGYWFEAVKRSSGGREKIIAYAKVVDVGCGGDKGEKDPSLMEWRIGSAKKNMKMQEHPQLGLSLGVRPAGTMLVKSVEMHGNTDNLYSLGGITLDVGYDLTPYTFNELWIRASSDFATRIDGDALLFLYTQYAMLEVDLYVTQRLNWFVGFGGAVTVVVLRNLDTEEQGNGKTYGIAGQMGFDIILHPDWFIRMGALWRQNFTSVEYEDGFTSRTDDKFTGLQYFAGLHYIW